MACFGPDAPEPRNYGQEMWETLGAQVGMAPALFASESKYQPKYTALALKNLDLFMNGTPNRTGFIEQYTQMAPKLQGAQNAATDVQREGDIAALERLGGRTTEALLGSNPWQKALLEGLNAQAQQGLELGSQVDPVTMRQIRNAMLGERQAAGWGFDPGDMAAVGMSTGAAGEAMKQQRMQNALQVLGANQSVLGDPFLQILGRPSGATGQIPGLLGQGQAAGQGLGPQLFNPQSGYASNLNAQNAAIDWDYKLANPSTIQRVGAVSNLTGEFLGSIGKGFFCWVAREVYGEEDARWLVFRSWLYYQAPRWLYRFYGRHGERFAGWLHRHEWCKGPVRWLMNIPVRRRMLLGRN